MNEHGGKSKNRVLALVSLASCMVALDMLVVSTALDQIRRDFGASIGALQWTANAYNLASAMLLLTGAAAGDRFGRRRMFASGLLIFSAASASCALSRGIEFLIAARAVQGAGAALIMPQAMTLLGAAFPGEERAKALGIFSGLTGLAVIAGPVVGGAIAWQWVFWINLPLGIAAIALAPAFLGESFGPQAGLDIRGLILATGTAVALVWPFLRGDRSGWTSAEAIAGLVAFVVLAAGFVAWERRAAAPMVPPHMFRSRAFLAGLMASFLLYAALYSALFMLPQFLQSALSLGPLDAGLRLLPWTATMMIFAPLGGSLVNRFGERNLAIAGLSMQAIGFAWLGLISGPSLALGDLAGPLLVAGTGASIAMPAVQNAVMGAVAPGEIGKASGTFNMARFLGGVLGIALIVAIFDTAGSVASPEAFSAGFGAAIVAAASLSLAGTVIALALPDRRRIILAMAKTKT